MGLSSKLVVKEGGIHGFCWFANEDIKCGEMLWCLTKITAQFDIFVTKQEVEAWPEQKRNKFWSLAYQVEGNLFCGANPDAPVNPEAAQEYYVNHSCDGNSWYENDQLLVAKRDIKAGEEITYDYALTEADQDWVLPRCLCETKLCRGRVTGKDCFLPELQARYGKHFLSHVLKLIQEQKNQTQPVAQPVAQPAQPVQAATPPVAAAQPAAP